MFTAHIDRINKERKQSVKEHSSGTAGKAAIYAKKLNLCKTAELQGLLHDAGKLCADFDDYINERNSIKRGGIDHAYAGAKYLWESVSQSDDEEIKLAAGYIARTVISHHGLHDWLDEDGSSVFDERISKNIRYDEICGNVGEIISPEKMSELLEASAEEINICHEKMKKLSHMSDPENTNKDIASLKYVFYCGLFERLMQSVINDADCTDTADFMQAGETERKYDIPEVWRSAVEKIEEKYKEFAKKTDRISQRRTKISENCLEFGKHNTGICRLIVPTGGGKTLSSLRFALEQCKNFGKEKIFYIAPFMSILEQNSDDIREIVGEDNFLEHYSDFAQSIDDKEEFDEYQLRTDKWDTPVISTTLVQFLDTVFSSKKTSVRRFHRLANSVIIIDEVQAIPVKCVNLFNLAVNFLSRICGASVVLCTATQPCLEDTGYPVEFDADAEMNPGYTEDFEFFRRTELKYEYRIEKYTFGEAADFCEEKFEEKGNLLVIVNTKKSAAELYGLLSERYNGTDTAVVHLSTGMCPQHRRDVIEKIKSMLKQHCPVICIATQLIEAGVDISFKCVVRSLAGLDNAAQAAGRCNRNGEDPICDVYIINLKDENLSRLEEISKRQDAANIVMKKKKYSDLLDVGAMNEYFRKFYGSMKDKLSYNVNISGENTNLVKVLSAYIQRADSKRVRIGTHIFKTAGDAFNVIDNGDAQGVIVPYNCEAKEIISELNSDISPSREAKLLRKAQKYTVSLYRSKLKEFTDNGTVYKTESGILILVPSAYDNDGIGIKDKAGELDLLIE